MGILYIILRTAASVPKIDCAVRLIKCVFFFRMTTLTAEDLSSLLSRVEQFDIFEVKDHLHKLCALQQNVVDNFSVLKLQLKKALIEELVKLNPHNNELLLSRLRSVHQSLGEKNRHYQCCLSWCRFSTNRHRLYVRHLKTVHPRLKNIVCNFQNMCLRSFCTVKDLIEHIGNQHSSVNEKETESVPVSAVDIPCKCNLVSCGSKQKQFGKIKDLLKHINNDHIDENRMCVFENCDKRFQPQSVSRHHFRLHHMKTGNIRLKPVHLVSDLMTETLVDPPLPPTHFEVSNEECEADYDAADLQFLEIDPTKDEDGFQEDDEYYIQYTADFYNRLVHFKYLPQATVQDIIEENIFAAEKARHCRTLKLRDSLSKHTNLEAEVVDKILLDVEDDMCLKALTSLNTQYKRTKYVQENMKYVAPVEIVLNKSEVQKGQKKDVLHYVPIDLSVKALVEDKTMVQVMEGNKDNMSLISDSKLVDIEDGSWKRTNTFFRQNPDALGIHLYSDGVELVNPLGAARGKYKVCQVFFTLSAIPKYQRSQVDRLQLVMVFKEKLYKKYPPHIIFKRLIEDLSKLENGISVNIPHTISLKCGVLLYSADNLEAHIIAGLSASFSSKSVCRWCHIQYDQLEENIHDEDGPKEHDKWTIQEYDIVANMLSDEAVDVEQYFENIKDCDELNENIDNDDENLLNQADDTSEYGEDIPDEDLFQLQEVENKWGIRHKCPFNVLQSFHCLKSFPVDLMHDWFEGVVAEDLLAIIRALSQKGWMSIDEYNKEISKFSWGYYEVADRPQLVPVSMQNAKLPGKAMSQWIHSRYFPLIMKKFILNFDDEILVLGLKLNELTERLTASQFCEVEVALLEDGIVEYLDLRKKARLSLPRIFRRPKPKHHFMR